MARKKTVDVKVIVTDASPILTLSRIGRLDLLGTFEPSVVVVDQVYFEVTRRENDPDGLVAAGLNRLGNKVQVVETNIGAGFRLRRQSDPKTRSGGLGELAVQEYIGLLADTSTPSESFLVLFEDPDILDLPFWRLKKVHFLNTTAWLFGLYEDGNLPEGLTLIDRINAMRRTPMNPIDREARTKSIKSTWRRRIRKDEDDA